MLEEPVEIPQALKTLISAPGVPLFCIAEPVLFSDH